MSRKHIRKESEVKVQDDLEKEKESIGAGAEHPANGADNSLDTEDCQDEAQGNTDTAEDSVIQSLRAEVKENYDKYLRALAEVENQKKRNLKERSDLLRYAGENLARDLLEVVDNLGRAVSQKPETGVGEEFFTGIEMIHSQLVSVLDRHGIKGESSLGEPFDPNKHQAMTMVPTALHPVGTVIEEFRKAYYFKDKLLRPAQVVVAKAIEEITSAASQSETGGEPEET